MMINTKDLGNNISLIEIKNNAHLSFVFANFGASLYSLHYDNEPLILELTDLDAFLTSPQFFNKTLGVVAGRLNVNGEINNVPYKLEKTGEFNYSLHGGYLNSLSFKPFTYKIKENKNYTDIIFKFSPRKGENGFPGKVSIKITYRVYESKDTFDIFLEGRAKEDTILNLSNHIYWNLGATKDINDYKLKMNTSTYALYDKDQENKLIDDLPAFLDFRTLKVLKPRLDFIKRNVDLKTIDNTFFFDEKVGKVKLVSPKYTLNLKTDYSSMNIYVDSSLTDVKFNNRSDFEERRAIALEPQSNLLNFKEIILLKGEKRKHYIKYNIKRNDNINE